MQTNLKEVLLHNCFCFGGGVMSYSQTKYLHVQDKQKCWPPLRLSVIYIKGANNYTFFNLPKCYYQISEELSDLMLLPRNRYKLFYSGLILSLWRWELVIWLSVYNCYVVQTGQIYTITCRLVSQYVNYPTKHNVQFY